MARISSRRTVRSGRSAPRRKFVWARAAGHLIVAAGDDTAADLLGPFEAAYGAQLIGCTITRIRGKAIWVPTAASTAPDSAWGIRVATEGSSVSGPAVDPHADWMAYYPVVVANGGAAGTDATVTTQTDNVDVKSMRKLEELDERLLLLASNTLAGTAVDLYFQLSIGIKLP